MSLIKRQLEQTPEFQKDNQQDDEELLRRNEFEKDREVFGRPFKEANENLDRAEKEIKEAKNILKDIFDMLNLEYEE